MGPGTVYRLYPPLGGPVHGFSWCQADGHRNEGQHQPTNQMTREGLCTFYYRQTQNATRFVLIGISHLQLQIRQTQLVDIV